MISYDQRIKLFAYVKNSTKEAIYHSMILLGDEIALLREKVLELETCIVVSQTIIDAYKAKRGAPHDEN